MPDTSDLRTKARRLKNLTLTRAIDVLEHPQDYDKETYEQTYLTALKNSIPRTQELVGEEGEAIKVVFDRAFQNESNESSTTS
jgi:hypothetical protein